MTGPINIYYYIQEIGKGCETLAIESHFLSLAETHKLAQALRDSQVRALTLSSNNLGDAGAVEIARVLRETPVQRLALKFNAIGDDGAQSIANSLLGSQVEFLDLQGNFIGENGKASIEKAVRSVNSFNRQKALRSNQPHFQELLLRLSPQ